MFCTECGKQIESDAKFCGDCGAAQVIDSLEQQSIAPKKRVSDNQYKHEVQLSSKIRDNDLGELVIHSADSSRILFITILKAAAVIGGFIWGIYLLVAWNSVLQLQDDRYGIAQAVKSAAYTPLMIQTFLASLLLFFGLKK